MRFGSVLLLCGLVSFSGVRGMEFEPEPLRVPMASIGLFSLSFLSFAAAQKADYIRGKHDRHEDQASLLTGYSLSAGDTTATVVFLGMYSISNERKFLFADSTRDLLLLGTVFAASGAYTWDTGSSEFRAGLTPDGLGFRYSLRF